MPTEKEMDDFDNIPMDNVPTVSDAEAYEEYMDEEEAKAEAASKTESEQAIEDLEALTSSSKLNSWERGFCESCLLWLNRHPANKLSYKQKDVLTKTYNKHFG